MPYPIISWTLLLAFRFEGLICRDISVAWIHSSAPNYLFMSTSLANYFIVIYWWILWNVTHSCLSDRKRRKKELGDPRRDYSGNLRISDRNEEEDREGKTLFTSRDTLEGQVHITQLFSNLNLPFIRKSLSGNLGWSSLITQLNKMQTDIEMAEHHKHQAEVSTVSPF